MLFGRSRGLVGLDIGDSSIKVIELKENKGGWQVSKLGWEPLSSEAIVERAPILQLHGWFRIYSDRTGQRCLVAGPPGRENPGYAPGEASQMTEGCFFLTSDRSMT